MKVQGLNTGYHIGFGGEFYTLWYVNFPDPYTGVQDANYHGRISKDESKVKKLYPDYPFSGLKGDEWNFTPASKDYKEQRREEARLKREGDTFVFGSYSGELIREHDDLKYVFWYYRETRNEVAKEVLLHSGKYFEYKGEILDESKLRRTKFFELFEEGEIFVELVSNFKAEGNRINVALPGDEGWEEEFMYGMEINVHPDLYDELKLERRYYKQYIYWVIPGYRSMKGKIAKIRMKGSYMTSIEIQ